MSSIIIIIIAIISFIFVTGLFMFIFNSVSNNNVNDDPHLDTNHYNEESYQRFSKFYGDIVPKDDRFDIKLYRIYTFVVNKGMRDIKEISEMSLCSLPETVMKIRYLKNKRLIDDLYIDTNNMKLIPCSEKDQELLDKYKPYIYGSHLQVDQIASTMPLGNYYNIEELKNDIYTDIVYLNNKGLINGIKINDVDKTIIYYSIEKRKVIPNLETVHCPNCGALNDVDSNSKTRCSYCSTIIVGSEIK